MKKIISIILIVLLIVLTGCGSSEKEAKAISKCLNVCNDANMTYTGISSQGNVYQAYYGCNCKIKINIGEE